MSFNTFSPQIVFQEVPDEVSLAFTVTGCTLGCKGCHSVDSWDKNAGTPLSDSLFAEYISRYQNLITCVLFFGGEWRPQRLESLLRYTRSQKLQTCLYTGLDDVPESLKRQLDYLKTGAYIKALGGLDKPQTNQQFNHLPTHSNLNYKFWKR